MFVCACEQPEIDIVKLFQARYMKYINDGCVQFHHIPIYHRQ